VIAQMHSMMTSSFEMLQSTMRGIYQQSQRAEQAVQEMSSHSRDLEIRMNEQRKADQNYYQDKIFSMIGAFCDRVERQIDARLKSLSVVELMNSKQNEVLSDVESMKASLVLMQKNSEASRGEISRIERNASEANEKLIDVQLQTQNTEALIRDTLQQIQNHRSEFKIIRSELKQTLESVVRIAGNVENKSAAVVFAESIPAPIPETRSEPSVFPIQVQEAASNGVDEGKLISELLDKKHRALEAIERDIEEQSSTTQSNESATMVLALLRAQKSELQRVASEAKTYLQEHQASLVENKNNTTEINPNKEIG
jgi:chromosome segregation ATPase